MSNDCRYSAPQDLQWTEILRWYQFVDDSQRVTCIGIGQKNTPAPKSRHHYLTAIQIEPHCVVYTAHSVMVRSEPCCNCPSFDALEQTTIAWPWFELSALLAHLSISLLARVRLHKQCNSHHLHRSSELTVQNDCISRWNVSLETRMFEKLLSQGSFQIQQNSAKFRAWQYAYHGRDSSDNGAGICKFEENYTKPENLLCSSTDTQSLKACLYCQKRHSVSQSRYGPLSIVTVQILQAKK